MEQEDGNVPLTKKEKLMVCVAFIISLVVAIAVNIYLHMHKKQVNMKYYNDLSGDKGSTCSESIMFATTKDPVYKWIEVSSLPTALVESVPVAKATVGYQRASVWRVISNMTLNNRSFFLNSPDPHMFGGVVTRGGFWSMSNMVVNWGLSSRLCLTTSVNSGELNPQYDGGQDDESCLWTTPIVFHRGHLALLFIGIPYRNATAADAYTGQVNSTYPYASQEKGLYLSNFASNARTRVSLYMAKTERGSESEWDYVYEGQPCDLSNKPIDYTPDFISYLAYPSLQCICHRGMCVIGRDVLFFHNLLRSNDTSVPCKCRTCDHFFHSSDIDDTAISMAVVVSFTKGLSVNVTFSRRAVAVADMKHVIECVNWWLRTRSRDWPRTSTTKNREEGIIKRNCSIPDRASITAVSFNLFEGRASVRAIKETIKKTSQSDMTDTVYCGLADESHSQVGLSDNLCAAPLEKLKSEPKRRFLNKSLESFKRSSHTQAVTYASSEWDKDRSRRNAVSAGILTAVITIVLTISGLTSKQFRQIESLVLHSSISAKLVVRRLTRIISMPLLRTVIRLSVLLITAGWSMYIVFISIQDITVDPQEAFAKTFMHHWQNVSLLVTLTSSIEVKPNWYLFAVVSSVVGIAVVVSSVHIYFRISHIPEIMEESTRG